MSETFSRVEVITGVARRRRFSTERKLAVVAETMQPGMSISYVARRPVSFADIPPPPCQLR
jgi:transposase